MRLTSGVAAVAAVVSLGACTPPAPAPQAEPEVLASFEDGGCIAVLQHQRAAVTEGRAQGDEATLTAAITGWRASAAGALTADELAQYEASSLAVEGNATPEQLAERASACIANAPQS